MADQKPTYEELVEAIAAFVETREAAQRRAEKVGYPVDPTSAALTAMGRLLLTRIRQGGESNG